VTSSAGNQAKIDDAPQSSVVVPAALWQQPAERRKAISTALASIFDKSHRERRSTLIRAAIPELFSRLAKSDDPAATVAQWLSAPTEVTDSDPVPRPDNLKTAARRMVRRLQSLSGDELAALRPDRLNDADRNASRQSAFERVWHRTSFPPGTRRHRLREALAVVAPLFALHRGSHQQTKSDHSFAEALKRQLRTESRDPGHQTRAGSLTRLLHDICAATPAARNELLGRIVALLCRESSAVRRIDFADLLLDVADWDAPVEPTTAEWYRLLPR